MARIPTKADIDVMARIVADAEKMLIDAASTYAAFSDCTSFRELKKRMHEYDMACLDFNTAVTEAPYIAVESGHLTPAGQHLRDLAGRDDFEQAKQKRLLDAATISRVVHTLDGP